MGWRERERERENTGKRGYVCVCVFVREYYLNDDEEEEGDHEEECCGVMCHVASQMSSLHTPQKSSSHLTSPTL